MTPITLSRPQDTQPQRGARLTRHTVRSRSLCRLSRCRRAGAAHRLCGGDTTAPGKYDDEYRAVHGHRAGGQGVSQGPFQERQRPLASSQSGHAYWNTWAKTGSNIKIATTPNAPLRRRRPSGVIEFARLVNKADDAEFQKQIGSYLDVDEFLRFLGVTARWRTWIAFSPAATMSICTSIPTRIDSSLFRGIWTCRSAAFSCLGSRINRPT